MKLVLIVEDERGNAQVMQRLLEAAGYRVLAASNGQAALALLDREKPDLILSDFMMPIMDGGEFGLAVRRRAAHSATPFVFLSGSSEAVLRRRFCDYDAFLLKPFDFDALLEVVGRLIDKGRAPPPNREQADHPMRQQLKGVHGQSGG